MILCCGEALIDMLPRETAQGEQGFVPYVGGAVFNTAIALGRLGVPVEFFTGLSSDFFGTMLKEALAASGVGLGKIRFSDHPTTLAFVRLTGGHASYAFFDENSAVRTLTEADLPALGDEVQALHFSCISLIPEPCGSTYETLLRREHGRRVCLLDPNIRRGFIKDKAAHLARMHRMIAMADIVKLSDEDLDWFSEAGSQDEIAARWLGLGPKLVIVTAGAKGIVGYTKRSRVAATPPSVTVIDTVGAGDTVNAGVLASLHRSGLLAKARLANLSERELHDALDLAVKAAAVTVSRAGANPPWAREL